MFELTKNSLAFAGGHSDDLSCQTCKILLGSPEEYQLAEIIYATEVFFKRHCMFTLGGAHYKDIRLNGVTIEQNRVYEAHGHDRLQFSGLERGFRLYLMAAAFAESQIACQRTAFEHYFSPPEDKIRLIKGPEFDYLKSPEDFLQSAFVISTNSDLAGLRLDGPQIMAQCYDISSSIVDDGLIQLTAHGPIVLLRERQVSGGYPRIFSVIKTDLDFLVQYPMGAVVHFQLISLEQAKVLLLQREAELKNFFQAMQR